LAVLECALWNAIFTGKARERSPGLYFLNVTQGGSSLLVLPGGVTIMTDAGSDDKAATDLSALEKNIGQYIDLAIISYQQPGNYKGYDYILDHYLVGAFAYNGRADNVNKNDWKALMDKISARHIPLITLGAGDRIHFGTASEIDILSPDKDFSHSVDPSDTALVQLIRTSRFRALLASDIGINVEDEILSHHLNVHADILKAPFPGLNMPAGEQFLHAVAPSTVMIAPGVKNTASQPSHAMLLSLTSSTKAQLLHVSGAFLLYNK
jgi:beta-lactamase superfamily II metal-dependent hydrolase